MTRLTYDEINLSCIFHEIISCLCYWLTDYTTNFHRIDNSENEKELAQLTKMVADIKGRMKRLDQETIDKFSDVFKVRK